MTIRRYGYDLVDPCRCLKCGGECVSLVPKKWFQCSPCSHGYHDEPCPEFIQQHPAHILVECGRCGWEKGEHAQTGNG